MPRHLSQRTELAELEGASLAFDGLDRLLGFSLRIAHGVMHRDFIASLAEVQISQRQTGALWLIAANPGVSQADLADALIMDRATMVTVLDRLESDGRILRTRSTSDRRRHELRLTPKGVKTLAAAKREIARHEKRFAQRLDPGDLAALLACLSTIIATGRGGK
jgi:DNA-binding MarR family transcriptional regulator